MKIKKIKKIIKKIKIIFILAISLEKLFELIVLGIYPPQNEPIDHAFLINYKYLISPLNLMEKLILTYCTTPSLFDNSKVHGDLEDRMKPVRLRVINLIKKWLKFHP